MLFTRSLEVTNFTLRKTQASRLLSSKTISTTIQKRGPSVFWQSCSDGIARKLPCVATHKFRKLT